ncbi:hypothetical protein ACMFMG_006677 [Clarireedia jacksonii]
MMIASAFRVQRVIRVVGRRWYNNANSPPWNEVGRTPIRRVETSLGHPMQPLKSIKHLRVKVANTGGNKVDNPLLAPDLHDGDVLHTYRNHVQLPFSFGDRLVSRLWLRDTCPCPRCRRQDTLQRDFDLFAHDLLPESTFVLREKGLEVTWGSDHIGFYPWEWLYKYYDAGTLKKKGLDHPGSVLPTLWRANVIKDNPPSVEYDEVMESDKGVGTWTYRIRKYGFCFVENVPVCPHKTQELLERISFVRPTHYGGFYDFTSDLTMKDTAYTNEAIGPHTDTTYFTDPAGLQMFHLLSHEDGTGGETLLVDGFGAVHNLPKKDYDVLARYNISWHASGNDGINIIPSRNFPVITNSGPMFPPLQIRWNNADRRAVEPSIFEPWVRSAKAFSKIVNSPENQYWVKLQPGRALREC